MARAKLRFRSLAIALASILAVQGITQVALRVRPVHDALQARMQRALGRSVEVGSFSVSVWTGVRFEANYITIGEDPQFGYEFTLRADRLAATPRWRSLVRGRLEFTRFALERPSLNVVRDSEGHWNFERWPAAWRPAETAGPSSAGTVAVIAFRNGRINFKRGGNKLAFSLAAVGGQISPAENGRSVFAMEAQPLRAGVSLQDAGSFHCSGILPSRTAPLSEGTTFPFPVEFSASWDKAALSDVLRLIAGRDFGVRGSLEGMLTGSFNGNAAVEAAGNSAMGTAGALEAPGWKLTGTLRVADVHRWDLPMQARLPGINVSLDVAGSADRHAWAVRGILVEARRSQLRGTAEFQVGENARASLRVVSASIHLDDLLEWYRAFHPGVAPGAALEGYLGADVALEGWPLSVIRATLATTGARLTIPGGDRPIELKRAVIEADGKGARLQETQLLAGAAETGFQMTASANWTPGMPFQATLAGGTSHLAEISNALAALGLLHDRNPLRAEGSFTARLGWTGAARPWRVSTTGTVALADVTLSGGLLQSAVSIGRARLDFLPSGRRVQIGTAKAFGTSWTGTLHAATLRGPWDFMLNAERLNPALVVRGFGSQPTDDSSLLSRILPSQTAAAPAGDAPSWPSWLRGEGTLSANSLELGRLHFDRLQGRLAVGEHGVSLDEVQARSYGGWVQGEVRSEFGRLPGYRVRADFGGVNVAALAAVASSTRQCCTGTGAGHLELQAAGWTRDALFSSLAGSGHAEVRSASVLTLDLPRSLAAGTVRPGRTAFIDSSADFGFGPDGVRLTHMLLGSPAYSFPGQGTVTYRGELDVIVFGKPSVVSEQATDPPAARSVRIAGTLAAPSTHPE